MIRRRIGQIRDLPGVTRASSLEIGVRGLRRHSCDKWEARAARLQTPYEALCKLFGSALSQATIKDIAAEGLPCKERHMKKFVYKFEEG